MTSIIEYSVPLIIAMISLVYFGAVLWTFIRPFLQPQHHPMSTGPDRIVVSKTEPIDPREAAIEALTEEYLDRIHDGETPDIERVAERVPEEDRPAAISRMRFIRLMHRAKPEPGDGE